LDVSEAVFQDFALVRFDFVLFFDAETKNGGYFSVKEHKYSKRVGA